MSVGRHNTLSRSAKGEEEEEEEEGVFKADAVKEEFNIFIKLRSGRGES